jgi:hypothetical protein
MPKWYKAATSNGIAAEHIPLYDSDKFQLAINYREGYESIGGWVPGYFFVGVLCKNPHYGHLYVHQMNRIATAEDAVEWIWRFTGFPHASIKELKKVIDTNGNLPRDLR